MCYYKILSQVLWRVGVQPRLKPPPRFAGRCVFELPDHLVQPPKRPVRERREKHPRVGPPLLVQIEDLPAMLAYELVLRCRESRIRAQDRRQRGKASLSRRRRKRSRPLERQEASGILVHPDAVERERRPDRVLAGPVD